MAESLEREVPIELGQLLPGSDLLSHGRATMLTGSADYAWNHRHVQLFGTASSYLRYVHPLDRIAAGSQNLNAGADVRLPKRGNLEISQGATYVALLLLPAAFSDDPAGPWRSGSGKPRVSNRPERIVLVPTQE